MPGCPLSSIRNVGFFANIDPGQGLYITNPNGDTSSERNNMTLHIFPPFFPPNLESEVLIKNKGLAESS